MPKKEVSKPTESKAEPKPQSKPTESKPKEPAKEIQGEGFVMREGFTRHPHNTYYTLDDQLAQKLNLKSNTIGANLTYLYNLHKKDNMFASKGDTHRTIRRLIKDNDYAGDSLQDPNNTAYIAKRDNNKMSDMAISRKSQGVFHLNKNIRAEGEKARITTRRLGRPHSQHRQLAPGAQMNTSKEHFSPSQSNNTTKDIKAQENYTSPMERK